MNDVNSLTSSLIEYLIQTVTNIISAQEKLEELDKHKFSLQNSNFYSAKNAANRNKLKTLLAGIQIGTQMVINKAKNIYSFENLDDLASNLRVNYAASFENLIPKTNQQTFSDETTANKNNNKISSYLNIVTSTIHQAPEFNRVGVAADSKQYQHKQQCEHPSKTIDEQRINDHCAMKCVSTCVESFNEITQRSISPKKVTNEYTEFDVKYPSGKIDIWYPRAKINICSDTPQIDLKLPEPLVEYKNFSATNENQKNNQTSSSIFTNSFVQMNKLKCNQQQGLNVQTLSYKPKLFLDSVRTESFTAKPMTNQQRGINDDLKTKTDLSNVHVTIKHSNSIRQAVSCASNARFNRCENKDAERGHDIKVNVELNQKSNTNTSYNEPSSIEIETENFVQTMINSGCEALLQQLLQKYILLDNFYKKNHQDHKKSDKIKEYNEWLKRLYSVDEDEASRIQSYIDTWYMNCMMEKLDINNK